MTGLRIAMVGLRGLPAQAGGVERHVEELATRLVERGHDVTAFCRPGYAPDSGSTYRGIRLATLPTLPVRGGEAFVHSGLGAMAASRRGFDVAHFHAMGPGLFTPLTRILGRSAIVQTIHGLDQDRGKWGGGARRVLTASALVSAHVPDEVVVVSHALGDHYRDRYGRYTTYISNGTPTPAPVDLGLLTQFGLRPQEYIVFVGRMVPEKDPILLVRAFRDIDTDLRLVLVGGSSHSDGYLAELRALAAQDPRVMLVGYQYGAELAALISGARLFVQPSLLEGLPISLLEAAVYAVPVVASDIAPHLEVLGAPGPGRLTFRAGDAASLRSALVAGLGEDRATARTAARRFRDDVTRRYDWSVATDRLEAAYWHALQRRRSDRQAPAVAELVSPSVPAVPDPVREVAAG